MTLSRIFRPSLFIAFAGLLIAAVLWHVRMNFPFDDSYITYRYAYNLAHGYGIVWNPGGPHTEGYTNFLYVLLLTPFSALGWDLVLVSQIVNVIAVIVTAIAVARITNYKLRIASGDGDQGSIRNSQIVIRNFLAPALLLLDPFTWFNAFSGMETSLFAMFVMLAVASIRSRDNEAVVQWPALLPAALCTLATLTRPEGGLLGLALFLVLYARRDDPKVVHSFLAAFALPLMFYAAWKQWYFGSELPNSFYVKVAQAGGLLAGRGAMRIYYESVWYLLVPAAVGVALSRMRKERSRALNPAAYTLAIWCVALSIFYLFSVLIMNLYDRFMYSVEISLIVLAAFALSRIRHAALRLTIGIVLVALQLICSLTYRGGWRALHESVAFGSAYAPLERTLVSIPHHEQITLCWSDAGYLPYYTHIRHIDPVGLNTTAIAHARTPQEVDRIIARARPEIIFVPYYPHKDSVYTEAHGLIAKGYATLMSQPELASYKQIATYHYPIYDIRIFSDTLSPHYGDIRKAFD